MTGRAHVFDHALVLQLFQAAFATAAGLLVVVGAAYAWAHREARVRIALALVVATAAGFAVFGVLQPDDVPAAWLTPLQEGNSLRTIEQLYAQTAHAGAAWSAFVSALADGGRADMRFVVWADLWLAVVAGALLWLVVRERTGRPLVAWGAVVAWGASPVALNALFSEQPSILLSALLLAGLVGVVASRDAALGRGRVAGLALAVTCGVLAVAVRGEMGALVVPALAMSIAAAVGWEHRLHALGSAARRRLAVVRTWSGARLALTGVAAVLALAVAPGLMPNPFDWAIASLNPLDTWWLDLPVMLREAFPWSVALLALAGGVVMARAASRWCLLPYSLLWLVGTYHCAAHGTGFEMRRYLSMPLVLFVVLAAEGWRAFEQLAARRAGPRRWQVPAIVTLLAFSVQPYAQSTHSAWLREREARPADALSRVLLDRAPQRELRWLLPQVEQEPGCAFVARVRGPKSGGGDPWVYAVFGGPVPELRTVPATGSSAVAAAAELAPGVACVRVYRSLDCAFAGASCDADVGDAHPLESTAMHVLAYSDSDEYGELPGSATLALWAPARSDATGVARTVAAH